MKLTRFANLIVIGAALTFAVVGCKKNPSNLETIYGQRLAHSDVPDGSTAPPIAGNPDGLGSTNGETFVGIPLGPGHQGWERDTTAFAADVVHFDFDSASLKSSEKSKVAHVADFLKANADKAVEVQGHCDERGTEEYNRSLGERRALAIREELVRLGIDPNRVDTISFGEDQPANSEHNEAAWRQNRRGEFVLLSPPK